MRYIASIVFGCLGTLLFFAGVFVAAGVHDSGNTLVGIILAVPGIGMLIATHYAACDLQGARIIRGAANVLLGLGSAT